MVTKEERGVGGMNQELSVSRYTLLYIKQINNKGPPGEHREPHTALCNHLQGKTYKRKCVTKSL